MDLSEIGWVFLILVIILDVVGWWITLFLWVIPTSSIALGNVLSLSLGAIIGLIVFFAVWMPLMIAGIVALIGFLAGFS